MGLNASSDVCFILKCELQKGETTNFSSGNLIQCVWPVKLPVGVCETITTVPSSNKGVWIGLIGFPLRKTLPLMFLSKPKQTFSVIRLPLLYCNRTLRQAALVCASLLQMKTSEGFSWLVIIEASQTVYNSLLILMGFIQYQCPVEYLALFSVFFDNHHRVRHLTTLTRSTIYNNNISKSKITRCWGIDILLMYSVWALISLACRVISCIFSC